MKVPIKLTVNGRSHESEVAARTLLVNYLWDDPGLTGAPWGTAASPWPSQYLLPTDSLRCVTLRASPPGSGDYTGCGLGSPTVRTAN